MSCAAFTFLGIWVAAANKGRDWLLWSSFGLGLAFVLFAAYKAWADEHEAWVREHEKVAALTEKLDVTITVHGICAHVAVGSRSVVVVPDVSVINQSHGLRV